MAAAFVSPFRYCLKKGYAESRESNASSQRPADRVNALRVGIRRRRSEVFAQVRADALLQPVVRPKGQAAFDEADVAAMP